VATVLLWCLLLSVDFKLLMSCDFHFINGAEDRRTLISFVVSISQWYTDVCAVLSSFTRRRDYLSPEL
jgi:hypothetical protein